MTWPENWPFWRPEPGAETPGNGGMTQLAAYEAGLTDDPGCWIQPVKVYWDPRLDPDGPDRQRVVSVVELGTGQQLLVARVLDVSRIELELPDGFPQEFRLA